MLELFSWRSRLDRILQDAAKIHTTPAKKTAGYKGYIVKSVRIPSQEELYPSYVGAYRPAIKACKVFVFLLTNCVCHFCGSLEHWIGTRTPTIHKTQSISPTLDKRIHWFASCRAARAWADYARARFISPFSYALLAAEMKRAAWASTSIARESQRE